MLAGNNCDCADHCTDLKCFLGDVNAVISWGFDSLKLDGCGKQNNIQLWYDMFNWTLAHTPGGKPMLLENCHNGPSTGTPGANSPFGPSAPTREWCPFHMYRSSNDIRPQWGSILSNLQTIPPLAAANLSRPGCWAYPLVPLPSSPKSQCTRPLPTVPPPPPLPRQPTPDVSMHTPPSPTPPPPPMQRHA
jgi:hypothetical protein